MTEHTEHKTDHHEHKDHSHEHKTIHHEHRKTKKTNFWQIVSAILGVLLILSIFTSGFGLNKNRRNLSADEASNKALEFINTYVISEGQKATLNGVEEDNQLYKVKISLQGQEFDSYITKDGKLLFPSAIDMDQEIPTTEQPPSTSAPSADVTSNAPKSDKPEVELFVMSHCPFGTQAEKGMIPAAKALGDKIDFKLRFVYYAMHPTQGEVEEQLNQYCIQKEQTSKFLDYLDCFLKEGDGAACLTEKGIDKTKLDKCVAEADKEFGIMDNLEDTSKWLNGRFPKFNTDLELNQKYGVGGSPTLIINGVDVGSGRDSASYLKNICAAFNDAPEECNQELSSAQPSSGFGYSASATGAATAAQCG